MDAAADPLVSDWRDGQIPSLARRGQVLRGNRVLLGDQELVSCEAEARVVVKAAPSPAFIMTEADFLLECEIVAFYPAAQLCLID